MIETEKQRWPHTLDAQKWTSEFCKRFSVFTKEGIVQDQRGLMIGWFANAIMAGYDTAMMRSAQTKRKTKRKPTKKKS